MRFTFILVICLLIFAPAADARVKHAAPVAPAPSPPPISHIPAYRPMVVSYEVYVGGAHFLTAEILFQAQDGGYRTKLAASTYGFWHRLFPWDADLSVNGRIVGDAFKPVAYEQIDKTKKTKITRLSFDATGMAQASFEPPEDDPNPGHVTDEQKHALDPISALLQMLASIAIHDSCDVTVPVFDGKRRFDVTGADAGHESLNEADYSAFNGTARKCDASFTLLSGEWKDKEKAKFWYKAGDETGREPFHIWLGKLAPDLPELPVRLESGSVWGLLVVHLAKWHYATVEDLGGEK